MKDILNYLYLHKTLNRDEAKMVLTNIAKDKYNHSQIASFLSVYMMRNITIEELSGFREALLELCTPVNLKDFNTIDLCGTGGDGKNTFNISTLSSFVLAGAGYKVTKHGNYGVSSGCGSSNIMEKLGYKFSVDENKLRNEIAETGICYLHAPLFNLAMKKVAPVRKDLEVRTFFNMLGPLINPAFPPNQIVGVYNLELVRIYNYLYQQSDKNYIIFYSLDGYDEISLTGPIKMVSRTMDMIVQPEDLGFRKVKPEELVGGKNVDESLEIFMNVLKGKGTEAQNNVVLANSAVGIHCLEPDKSIAQCVDIAKDSLFGGKALAALNALISMQ
jgi:anthranilate phosphoribosyltransferase